MKRKLAIMFLISVMLLGCSISGEMIKDKHYSKENTIATEYQRDRYECEQESFLYASQIATSGRNGLLPLAVAVNTRLSRFDQCMRIRGYESRR